MTPYRRKFTLIAAKPDINIRVLTPNKWYESFQEIDFVADENTKCDEVPCPIRFSGYGSRFYYKGNIAKHFKDFKPDIIHLEEEAWSLNALQTVRLKRKYCPNSKFIFRTSLSIPSKQRFGPLPIWIEKRIFQETDIAFPLSINAGEILKQRGYKGAQIPFPNGVDISLFNKRDIPELKNTLDINECFVIGYIGRIIQMKGIDTLIEAAAKLDFPYKLLIVGKGEDKPIFESLAKKYQINQNIIWIDAVPPEKVPDYLNCMNTLILPSRTTSDWVEFFGRVLIEGMACEVPVIGSDSGEIPHVIGDAGFVFKEGDASELAGKINKIADDPILYNSFQKRGLERVQEFTWETIAQRTYDVYQDLLADRV
ncbi:glycosyltransferase [Candidatus Poribacteria bacterium]|nr:glycosyltransferase [Candidatus Poribacteria bacterium]